MATGPRFVRHAGIAAPFLRPHVEMEIIAPLVPEMHAHGHATYPPASPPHQHAMHVQPNGHLSPGLHCFEGLRYFPDGRENPEFVLNQTPYRNASILIAGENFGLGSLQAFAVIRLMACGMRAVIAPSFGPVFFEDCFVYGLLPVTLSPAAIAMIVRAIGVDPAIAMTIDLEREAIEHPQMTRVAFHMNPRLRNNLLKGIDNLEEVLKHRRDAEIFEKENRKRRPWLYRGSAPR
jgi:3-isopropylmalate/(R)-2-methylmalate dehydratase small subunit